MVTWRFEELTGHLERVCAQGNMPHALLIAGSRLAQKDALLDSLLGVLYKTKGERIGNYFVVAPLPGDEKTKTKKDITIEQIRELKSMLVTRALSGTKRVVVIAPAQTLSTGAANALLKVLEEPPVATYFILMTDAWQEVPATILSRCEQYALATEPAAVYAQCADSVAQLEHLFGMPIYAQRKELESYLGDSKDHIAQRRKISELFNQWYCAAGYLLERTLRAEETKLAAHGLRSVHVVRFMRMLTKALQAIEHNIHPKLIFENVMVHLYAHI